MSEIETTRAADIELPPTQQLDLSYLVERALATPQAESAE